MGSVEDNTRWLQKHLLGAHECAESSAALYRPGQSHRELHQEARRAYDRDHPFESYSPST